MWAFYFFIFLLDTYFVFFIWEYVQFISIFCFLTNDIKATVMKNLHFFLIILWITCFLKKRPIYFQNSQLSTSLDIFVNILYFFRIGNFFFWEKTSLFPSQTFPAKFAESYSSTIHPLFKAVEGTFQGIFHQ